MKVKIIESNRPKYPYLGMHKDGHVVLFIKPDTGVIVDNRCSKLPIGDYTNAWFEYKFTPYNSSVKLENIGGKLGMNKYPYLGKSKDSNLIVLFTESCEGVVLNTDDPKMWRVGERSNGWAEHLFKPFEGTVVLSNDNVSDIPVYTI